MNSRRFWVKGNRDDYAHYLARTNNANLLDVSSPFRFEIKSREFSSLILRHVSVWGQCSNSYHLQDAFIGLMIALPGSGFSTQANGQVDLKPCDHHRIHWQFASDDLVYAHHLDSNVLYIRLETARLLRELAQRGLAIADILLLQGQEASAGLIRLCEPIERHLEESGSPEEQDAWADRFLIDLIDELQFMGSLKANPSSSASGMHVAASLQWLCKQNAATTINLNLLAKAINVTPRTIQISFQKQFRMTPMRWLKLWRINQLHRLLFNNLAQHANANALIQESGLGSITTASRAYRTLYGRNPSEELSQTNLTETNPARKSHKYEKSTYTINEAIQFLSSLKEDSGDDGQHDQLIILKVKLDHAPLASGY
jgi:AraC-like DNA-binding protein